MHKQTPLLTITFTITALLSLVVGIALYQFIKAEFWAAEPTEQVFVYGTLKSPLVRFYACRCITTEEPAKLAGYRKVGRDIVADETEVIEGLLLEVNETELNRLDRYERIPHQYRRFEIKTAKGDTAWVYQLSRP